MQQQEDDAELTRRTNAVDGKSMAADSYTRLLSVLAAGDAAVADELSGDRPRGTVVGLYGDQSADDLFEKALQVVVDCKGVRDEAAAGTAD